jgi:hypothetical protein
MTTFTYAEGTRNRQRGIALLMAVVGLFLISAMAAGMIIMANTETNISSNYKDEQLAFFSAKAGIEEARDRMQKSPPLPIADSLNPGSLPTTLPGTTGSVLYILNPANGETVAPWKGSSSTTYPDDEICKETSTIACSSNLPNLSTCSTWCTSTTASSTYAASPVFVWKWVRITLKQNNALTAYSTNGDSTSGSQVCWNGTNEETTSCTSPNLPVYVMTSLAVTPSGSRRMVQAEIAEDRLSLTLPGPLTLDGPTPSFSNPSGNNFGITGIDTAGCGGAANPADNAPAIVVPNAGDVPTIKTDITGNPPNRKDHYTGVDGTTPDVNNATMPTSLNSVSSLQTLVSTLKSDVTEPVITGPATDSNITNFGAPGAGNGQIIYVNGDLTLNPSAVKTGYGILVVTGNLTMNGKVGWDGLILVVGKGSFTQNGGGSGQYNGAVVVAKTLDGSGNPLTTGLGVPTFNFGGGGNNGINFSSGCIASAETLGTFHANVIRELLN